MEKQWFESWFDTPYYHLLYKNRDDREAHDFLDLVLTRLPLTPPAPILDLACGKGRHAIYLSQKGFDVTGMDLSPANIEAANRWAHAHLRFVIRDMRNDLGHEQFAAVFNLFTGFGYFENDAENFAVFANVYRTLRPGGIFLFDYLNERYVRNLSTEATEFDIDGVRFRTRKEINDGWVIKHIEVGDGEHDYRFSERVALYTEADIRERLTEIGFTVNETWGNYRLEAFGDNSPRLILQATKK